MLAFAAPFAAIFLFATRLISLRAWVMMFTMKTIQGESSLMSMLDRMTLC